MVTSAFFSFLVARMQKISNLGICKLGGGAILGVRDHQVLWFKI